MSSRSLPSTSPAPGAAARSAASYQRPTHVDLLLIRHGESTWNTAGLCQGHNDEAELTARGLRQAADAAADFGYRQVRAIYASDLRRAQQTAAAFASVLGLPVHADPRLRERCLGVLEGRPHAAIGAAELGHGDGVLFSPDTRPAGGESVRDLYRRASGFCAGLVAGLRDGRDTLPGLTERTGDVLIITHGGTVRVLEAYLRGVTVDQMSWRPVDNAALSQFPCPR